MVPFKEALIEVLPRKCRHEECHYDDSPGAIQRGINGRQREVKVCEDSTMDKLSELISSKVDFKLPLP
jgi:hypothetical protein